MDSLSIQNENTKVTTGSKVEIIEAFTGPIIFIPAKNVTMATIVEIIEIAIIHFHCSKDVGMLMLFAKPFTKYTNAAELMMTVEATKELIPLVALLPTRIYIEYTIAAVTPKVIPKKFIFSMSKPITRIAPVEAKISAINSSFVIFDFNKKIDSSKTIPGYRYSNIAVKDAPIRLSAVK